MFEPAGAPRRERDGAPGVRVLPVAAAVEEAAYAAKGVSERDDRAEEVRHLEHVLALDEAPDEKDGDGEDEPAVEHEPALVDADDQLGMAGELRLPVFDYVCHARADDAGHHQ